jgi:hypothetical protein
VYANGGLHLILEVVHHDEKGVIEYRVCPWPTETLSVFRRGGNPGLWPSMDEALA